MQLWIEGGVKISSVVHITYFLVNVALETFLIIDHLHYSNDALMEVHHPDTYCLFSCIVVHIILILLISWTLRISSKEILLVLWKKRSKNSFIFCLKCDCYFSFDNLLFWNCHFSPFSLVCVYISWKQCKSGDDMNYIDTLGFMFSLSVMMYQNAFQ